MDAKKNETRDRRTGQYAYSRWEMPCTCGHTLGEHTAAVCEGQRPCLAEDCDCDRFKKARR